MNKSKSFTMALSMLSLGAATSFAEIKLTDNLSTAGFLDMSASGVSPDSGDATAIASFDQFELDFFLKYGAISARADINSLGPVGGVTFEQGFVTATSGALSLTLGKFLSCSGFEAAEPTGLYQYSVSKLLNGYAGATYGGYESGVNVAYTAPKFALYGAVLASVWGIDTTDIKDPGFEAQLALMPMEGLTAKFTYLHEMIDDPTDHDSQSEVNAWASFSKGALTVAAEYSILMNWLAADESGNGWLAMINFKATDKVAATVRYSGVKLESIDDPDTEVTFSPSYALASNWLALAEVKYEIDAKATSWGIENTLSF